MRRSLNARLLLGAGISLLVFMVFLGWILDRAFRESALRSVVDRLQAEVYMLLGATDISPDGGFSISTPLPEPRLEVAESDLYARILDDAGMLLWRSPSAINREFVPPRSERPGAFVFERVRKGGSEPDAFTMHFTVLWEGRQGAPPKALTLQVAETLKRYSEQVRGFRQSLFFWFVLAGAGFLAVNTWLLRRALKPIRDIADEVNAIESGEKEQLSGNYPTELQPLATNLNVLINQGQNHVKRYRNALGDLAHSLKTPLAVIRTSLDKPAVSGEDKKGAIDQLNRVDATIQYQLQRAAAAHQSTFGASVEIAPIVSRLVNTLRKVHADRGIRITSEVEPGARFFGDQQDLYEILGNLADNACKWAARDVRIAVRTDAGTGTGQRPTLIMEVTDDGPGMTRESFERFRRRGVRGDTTVDGHGIGLAMVSDLVENAYTGRLELLPAETGTRVGVALDFG